MKEAAQEAVVAFQLISTPSAHIGCGRLLHKFGRYRGRRKYLSSYSFAPPHDITLLRQVYPY